MAGGDPRDRKPDTRLVAAGRKPEWTGPAVNPPVWRASTYLYEESAAQEAGRHVNADGVFHYGARGGPTQWALADALTELEPGAAGTMLYPTGLAAPAIALLSVLKAGDEVLVSDNSYDPTRSFALHALRDYGIGARFFDPLDVEGFAATIGERTKAVLLENPGSLTMEVCDVPALAAIARDKGAVTLIDNTWASPLGFPALERGCDIAIMSLTKHVGGHSDLMMGSAAAGEALYGKLRGKAQAMGHVVSPDDAALALRGLRTLAVRLNHETSSCLEIAKFLLQRAEIAHILCPMLPGSPGHELWARDFTGGCGLFSFVFQGGTAAARDAVIDALSLFGIGYSWGGFESLVTPLDPAPARSATPWPPAGTDPADRFGLRLSIGLEDPGDLIADLERGLAAWSRA